MPMPRYPPAIRPARMHKIRRRAVLVTERVRAFLAEPRFAVMATINRSGTPQLTVMWYALLADEDVVVLNATRGLLKERNLRRDPRRSLCIEDGMRYVTLGAQACRSRPESWPSWC